MTKGKGYEPYELKDFIKLLLDDNLTNFDLVEGGQQRTIGDLIENKIVEILFNVEDDNILKKRARSKKSIEDLTIISKNVTYYIDPKTHDINSEFSMPNLTSVEKIRKLFLEKNLELIYIFVSYQIINNHVTIEEINVFFIWELDISILGVGNLGKGQLQIKNANEPLLFTQNGKENWYLDFRNLVQNFLENQSNRIEEQKKMWN